jgi:hypothetical protein
LFGENVTGIETRRNIFEGNKVAFNPVKKRIFTDVNMARLLGRLSSTGHEKSATVVLVDNSSKLL